MTPGQLYLAGNTLRQIARHYAASGRPVSHETVRLWVRAEGVAMRAYRLPGRSSGGSAEGVATVAGGESSREALPSISRKPPEGSHITEEMKALMARRVADG